MKRTLKTMGVAFAAIFLMTTVAPLVEAGISPPKPPIERRSEPHKPTPPKPKPPKPTPPKPKPPKPAWCLKHPNNPWCRKHSWCRKHPNTFWCRKNHKHFDWIDDYDGDVTDDDDCGGGCSECSRVRLGTPDATSQGLVIITPQRFENELKPFIQHKRRDLPVEVVTLERVLFQTKGVDDPEKLKRFLYEAWKTRHARYVLLVGDASVIPVRYIVLDRIDKAAYDTAFYACDLYYADVAKSDGRFDDWQARKDGHHALYFGEVHGEKNKNDPINVDKIGYQPKLAVGRWPVNTPDQVTTMVSKTIAFENQVTNGSKGRPRIGLIAAEHMEDARESIDSLAEFLPKASSIHKRYYQHPLMAPDPPAAQADLIGLFSSGVDLLIHVGHTSETLWEDCLSMKYLDQIKNEKHIPVILSRGCSTARFTSEAPYEGYVDIYGVEHKGTRGGEVFTYYPPPPAPYQRGRFNPRSLGKDLVNSGPNGAVAYIGCNTGAQPCSQTLLEGFAMAWGCGELRLGDCWVDAVWYYYDTEQLAKLKPTQDWLPPSVFFQAMKFMVYGDPSLRLPR